MNSLVFTMQAEEPIILPLAYNRILQGVLYSLWKSSYPQLHDRFYEGSAKIRPFVFGQLKGNCRVQGKQITFFDAVSLEVRSTESDLIEALADAAANADMLRLGRSITSVTGIRCADQLLFSSEMRIRMNSPLTAYITEDDGKTRYFDPEDAAFCTCLEVNLDTKLRAMERSISPVIQLTPIEGIPIRKCVTTFKGTYITAFFGDFLLKSDPESASILYYSGIGQRNSQGFGLFDLI